MLFFRLGLLLLALTASIWPYASTAGSLSLQETHAGQALGRDTTYLEESGTPLSLNDAITAYQAGGFSPGTRPMLTFGIDRQAVWIRLSIFNPQNEPQQRRLSIENPWLDHLDVYFLHDGRLLRHYNTGDSLPFADRPILNRFFTFDHDFDAGISDIYLRIETPDPIMVPIFLAGYRESTQREIAQAYSYGFLYGYLLALLAYNLLIYFGLRKLSHLLYALFIGIFILGDMAYSGHGFAWLWPNHVIIQRWAIPVLILFYGVTGLRFAQVFLDTKHHFPAAHRAINRISVIFALLVGTAIAADSPFYANLITLIFATLFISAMLLLGTASLRTGCQYARYFLLASIASIFGSSITIFSVWNVIPLNGWSFRAVEVGMVIDATLLALALSSRLRTMQREHKLAERLAALDPLTQLNNRRAFYDQAHGLWQTALCDQQPLSVIILDIDHFKSINDRHGHAIGDAALIAVGKTLTDSARTGDIVTRWGGEEFVVLLPETEHLAAIAMAERLRKAIAAILLPTDSGEISFTASFGVAYQNRHESLNDLITEADHNLYQSKQMGRNKVSFSPS